MQYFRGIWEKAGLIKDVDWLLHVENGEVNEVIEVSGVEKLRDYFTSIGYKERDKFNNELLHPYMNTTSI